MHDTSQEALALIERVTSKMLAGLMAGCDRRAVRTMAATGLARLGMYPLPTDERLEQEAYLIEHVPSEREVKDADRRAEERAARRDAQRSQPWRKGHA